MGGYNKTVFGGKVLIDLTGDTVTPDTLLKGLTAHSRSGDIIEGECEFDSNTSDATATSDEILSGQTAYINGNKVTGTMPNNDPLDEEITSVNQEVTIPIGFHDGSGKVTISEVDKAKIIPSNILKDVNILGVIGEVEPSSNITAQEKTVMSSVQEQVVLPDDGYTYLSQVTVQPISYTETENSAGGITVTIGASTASTLSARQRARPVIV